MIDKNTTEEIKNKLYYGDNLTILKGLPENSIDLIYLDPPFNSKKTYNLMYKNMTGEPVDEQVEAFCDSWEMDEEKQDLMDNMHETMRHYKVDADFINFCDSWIKALKTTQPKLLAYLLYMTVRLLEMKRVLKETGSIYLHCDPTASHYIKIIMDGIFGHNNFRNEIVWCYTSPSNTKRWFPKKHHIILFYTKTDNWKFNYESVKIPYKKLVTGTSQSGIFKANKTLDVKGKVVEDYWTDITPVGRIKTELLGYPTQKPTALLDRIIKASCPEGGIVLDPFCGCGTTIYSAHLNKKNWIGIDIAILSTRLVKDTLLERYELEENKDYTISGIPVSVEEAKYLWEQDHFQFQNWAVEYVKGFCTIKKTRDSGIDGRLYFNHIVDSMTKELKSMIISVKGGKLKASDIRDLIGTVEKEGAVFGGLISFDTPSKDMREAASKLGLYTDTFGNKYSRIQFLTVKEMLKENKLFKIPQNVDRKDFSKESQDQRKLF